MRIKLAQVAERRIAGAEIVHGNTHALVLELFEGIDCGTVVVHGHILGDFQLDLVGADVRAGQCAVQDIFEARPGQLCR